MLVQRIDVEGFRAFGPPQELVLGNSLTVLYGENSKGKTSLAEAIEFLFCGTTSRRDVVASTKTEFAKGLVNTHYVRGTWVGALLEIIKDGAPVQVHLIRRLLHDYPDGNASCVSELVLVDGNGVEAPVDFEGACGQQYDHPITLPVIFQHTLRYVSSAKPSDRKQYFRQLLDVQDIAELRDVLQKHVGRLTERPSEAAEDTILTKLDKLAGEAQFIALGRFLGDVLPSMVDIEKLLVDTMRSVLSTARRGLAADARPEDVVEAVRTMLPELRAQLASLPELRINSAPWDLTAEAVRSTLEACIAELKETSGVVSTSDAVIADISEDLEVLFEAALSVPVVRDVGDGTSVDCPLCETPGALSAARIRLIRESVDQPNTLHQARRREQAQLAQIESKCSALVPFLPNQVGAHLQGSDLSAVKGYSDASPGRFENWFDALSHLIEANAAATTSSVALRDAARTQVQARPLDIALLEAAVQTVSEGLKRCEQAFLAYETAERELSETIRLRIDEVTGLYKVASLLDLWTDRPILQAALKTRRARRKVKARFDQALQQITAANADVLKRDKFPSLSTDVAKWWQILRPGEPVSFSDVRPVGQGLASIDIKCSVLDDPADQATVVERDAVALFSDSQLNCLGLSLFLARAERESSGFVVFDDPIQSMDSEHKDLFVYGAVKELLRLGFQVIVLTHDLDLWENLRVVYAAEVPKCLKITKPVRSGALVEDMDSKLSELLKYVAHNGGTSDPVFFASCANKVRTALEVLCKAIIVKETASTANPRTLQDLRGKMLPELITKARPYLITPASGPLLDSMELRTNPGSHDDVRNTPGSNVLQVFCGEIKKIAQEQQV